MSIALFNLDGLLFVLRWLHFFFGIIWIGLLYYFNFVQGSFFAETDATTKSNVIHKLVPRALWWFRWGAMFTFLSGLFYLTIRGHRDGMGIFETSWGLSILTGSLFGTFMWGNVWFVIWPNQKILIESASNTVAGKPAHPQAAAAALRAGVASRTNTLFSIALLFFMGAASHLPIMVGPTARIGVYFTLLAILVLGIEFNALKGKNGPMTTVKGVITCGFALAIGVYGLLEFLTK